ncbi:MAG: nucleoside hydrolase [Bacteroidales bacterium]|nr:nucleoside hydrolase [Bacteroidales bacterium]
MKTTFTLPFICLIILWTVIGCTTTSSPGGDQKSGIPVIFDTDANNELDDQHALAYLLLNDNTFDVIGITVNATWSGGGIEGHYKEAERVTDLCGLKGQIPILKGANGGFPEIMDHTGDPAFDGSEAVDFILEQSRKKRDTPLMVLAVGKLTNVALALKKDPSIAERIRVVWLGSNYPEPGEYNQDNDTLSMSYILKTNVPFEMVTVRGGKSTGTAAVTMTKQEILNKMPGLGPEASDPVTGRHGGSFTNFGDYSVNLFEHIDYHDESQSRALFDMAAVAIVKDPFWASSVEIPCPVLIDNQWVEQPGNERKIMVWENFNRNEIIADFYSTFEINPGAGN